MARSIYPRRINWKTEVGYPDSHIQKGAVAGENVISFSTVKLKPPSNLTVKVGSDSNLWYYWNQSDPSCEENEVRYRINNREWDVSQTRDFRLSPHSFLHCHHLHISLQNSFASSRSFCINLPSSSSLYELQVRGKLGSKCGESMFWSEWSEPVLWGSNNSTIKTGKRTAAAHEEDGKRMKKILPSRSSSGQCLHVVVDPAAVLISSSGPHPDGLNAAAPWKVG